MRVTIKRIWMICITLVLMLLLPGCSIESIKEDAINKPLSIIPAWWNYSLPVIFAMILLCIVLYVYIKRVGMYTKNTPYEKMYDTLEDRFSIIQGVLCGVLGIVSFIYSIILAVNSGFSILVAIAYWFLLYIVMTIVVIFAVSLQVILITMILGAFFCMHIKIIYARDRSRFNSICKVEHLSILMEELEVFTLKSVLQNLYKSTRLNYMPTDLSVDAFFLNEMIEKKEYVIVDVKDGSSIESFYMLPPVYDELKTQIEIYLLNAGMHDIMFIVENTIGLTEKAYFIQSALNDMANTGTIIKLDIGTNPEEKSSTRNSNYIYQHIQSQKPMKSIEIEID